jgi:hypothetical protein
METKHQHVVQDEKPTTHFDEKAETHKIKPVAVENADYTGAEAKTDPAEIALVRKIDLRLMVRFAQRERRDSD